jgi:hypothetical protein
VSVDVESDLHGVLFSACEGTDSVFLHRPISYPDGHGYHQYVDLVAGPFRGRIRATSYESGALRAFGNQLLVLHANLRGIARLPFTYDTLKMTLEGDGLGHLHVEVLASGGGLLESLLKFSFRMDQTQLPSIIASIKCTEDGI